MRLLNLIGLSGLSALALFACGDGGGGDAPNSSDGGGPGGSGGAIAPDAQVDDARISGGSGGGPSGGDARTRPADAAGPEDARALNDAAPVDARVLDAALADARSADALVADAFASPDGRLVDGSVASDVAVPPADTSPPGADALLDAAGPLADAAPPAGDAAAPCNCGPEERCNVDTQLCEPIVRCDVHVDCAPGFCVNGICEREVAASCDCPEGWACRTGHCEMLGPCMDDAQCPEATHCNDGTCGRCRDNLECPGQTRCLSGACREPQTCFGDDFCLAGRQCAPEGYCVTAPGCVEDPHGDLGASENALAIGLEALSDLWLCEGTTDWFALTTVRPAVVSVQRPAALGPMTLELFAADQPFGALDYDLGRFGVSWVSMPAGQWLVRVSAPAGGNGPYTLDARESCVEDTNERPWRNDTPEGATTLTIGNTLGSLCADDVDHFLYRGPESASVRLDMANGDIQATADGQPLPANLVAGSRVEVRGAPGATYRLVVERRRDPAHRCATADALALDTPTEVFVLGGADDFTSMCSLGVAPDAAYRVHLDTPGPLLLSLPGAPPNSALAVYADCAAAPIDCRAGVERLALPEQPAGDYFVVVEGPAAGRLTVSARADGGGVCAVAGQLRLGFDTAAEIPAAPGGLVGDCLDPARPQVALRFTLPITSRVTLAVDAGGREVSAAIRSVCDDSLTQQTCQAGPDTTVVADRLVAGDYIALVEGVSGPIVVHVDAVPVP
jgi:hypothetical protein